MVRAMGPNVRSFGATDRLGIASRALTVVALLFVGVGLVGSHLKLDGFGLAGSLPVPYYIGLALLPVCSALEWMRGSRASGPLIMAHVVIFVVVVWTTPMLLEGWPPVRTTYQNSGAVAP